MELKLKIEVDKTDAKKELADIEQGVQGITKAAGGAEQAVTKTTKALASHAPEVTNVVRASENLVQTSQRLSGSLVTQTATMAGLNGQQAAVARGFATMASDAGLTMGAVAGLTGGLIAAAAAGGIVLNFLSDSVRHFFESSDAMKENRRALESLDKEWEAFKFTIGGAILGEDFSIVKPVKLLNAALSVTGALIAGSIEQTKTWVSWMVQLNNSLPAWMRSDAVSGLAGLNNLFSGAFPVAPNTMSGQGLQMWMNSLTSGNWTPTSADEALRLFKESERELEKAGKEAARVTREIREFWENISPGVHIGLPGGLFGNQQAINPANLSYLTTWLPIMAGLPTYDWHGGALSGLQQNLGQGVPLGWSGFFGGFDPSAFSPASATGIMPRPIRMGSTWGYNPFARSATMSNSDYAMSLFGTGMALYQGGQEVWNATSQGGAGRRAMSGALAGAQAGSIVPGIGTAIGAGVGALVGAIRGWLAPTEYDLRMRQLNTDRQSANQLLSTPGLAQAWNAIGPGNTPFSWDFLKTQAFHDPTAVKGYLDEMLQKTERLQSAMEKYGISWEDLGQQAKQSHVDMVAKELIQDFDVLVGAGADVNFVIEKMGGAINEFVQSAIRTGSEVPMAMKPLIERMIEMGLLTDKDGHAFKSLEETGIVFAKTMTQGFDQISKAIEHLAEALGYVPKKLDEITVRARKAGDELERVGRAIPRGGGTSGDDTQGRGGGGSGGGGDNERAFRVVVPVYLNSDILTTAVVQKVLGG